MELNKEVLQDKNEINTGIITWDTTDTKLQSSADLDWGASMTDNNIKTDDFELKWSDDENDKDSDCSDGGISMNIGGKKEQELEEDEQEEKEEMQQQIDVMAQQLKFVACLKILMEELSTLATGFEVDGGQLRYQLYVWLEKEVEALKVLCNYTPSETTEPSDLEQSQELEAGGSDLASNKPTLHEILVQEKLDFEAKVQRAAKRKRWLRGRSCFIVVYTFLLC